MQTNFGKLINEINPDVIISTHPFSTQMCGILKKKKKLDLKVHTIMTDFKYHQQWLVKHEYLDTYFVSNESMKQDLIKYGIDDKKIYSIGMPISQRFFREFKRKDVLNEFELKDNLKTILLFAGGKMGLARKNIFTYMEELVTMKKKRQIIAISGKNQKIYKKFKEIAKDKENTKIIEFTNKVPELMSISDVIITKPGGITSSEAIKSGVPILAINPIPGQEEENAEYLEKAGLAMWLKKDEKIEEKLEKILANENIRENLKRYKNLNPAMEICKIIFE